MLMDRKELLMQAGAEYSKENYESVIRLLSTYPDDAEVLFNKAIAEAATNKLKEAYEDIKRAYKLAPQTPHIALTIGKLLILSKNPEEAQIWFKKALAFQSDTEEAKAELMKLEAKLSAEEVNEELTGDLRFVVPTTAFHDLIGMEDVKSMLRQHILIAVERPDLYKKYGKRVGLGIILYGPPGCGKTAAARALAGEASPKVKMAAIGINQVLNMYVGNSEKNIHKIFEDARRNAPCILFFDEFNALGKSRAGNNDKASDAGTVSKVVDQMLAEMDGVSTSMQNIFVIGATNRPWEIDEALKRSGRFNKVIYIKPPDGKERKAKTSGATINFLLS